MTPDIIPCDGVLIFNPQSDMSSNSTTHFPNTVATVAYGANGNSTLGPPQGAIYRDFVSLDSDSSYANYTASDASNGGQTAGNMTLHTLDPVSIPNESSIEPKFLCQPNHVSILNDLNATGFISGQGNVQLVTTTGTGPYSMDSNGSSATTQFSSPFHLVNGPFLSIQQPQATQIGHHQHYGNQSQMVFMTKPQPPGHVLDDHSSGQSQINSSFSLSEVKLFSREY